MIPHHPKVEVVKFKRRPVQLWTLHIDKATRIIFENEEVDKKLVPAFLGNDSYCSRWETDDELWEKFCNKYLKASDLI